MTGVTRLIGIDAGTQKLGVGILDCQRGHPPRFVGAEVVTAPGGKDRIARLVAIAADLREVFAEYRPAAIAIEEAFVGKFPTAGLALGEARGVVIACATVPPELIFSFPSARWKASLGIPGNATKAVVQARGQISFPIVKGTGRGCG